MSEWKEQKLANVAEKIAMGPFGSNIKVATFKSEGIPIVSGKHLHETRMRDIGFNYITLDHADKLKNCNVYRGDVIFTHAGNIGQVSFIPDNSEYTRYVISQRQFYLRPDKEKLNSEYITYYFKSPNGQHQLLANANQTGVPSLAQPATYIKNLEVILPSLYEQKAIASVLSSLDDKIDLLHRQNKTLEAMAETLFRQWFVEEAQEDWEEGTLSNFAINPKDGVRPRDFDSEIKYIGLEHIDRRSIALIQSGSASDVTSNKFKFSEDDILFGKLRPYFHKVCFAPHSGVCSTDILVIRPKKPDYFAYCLFAFYQSDVVEYANLGSGGTRMPRTNWETLRQYPVAVPNDMKLRDFNNLVVPSANKIKENIAQIHTLEKLRDTLLPKLMSGEVRVAV